MRMYACRLDYEGERLLQPFGWGLIPRWAKDPRIGSKAFNARAETVATKPMFRQAYRKHRALVPVDGFFEWQRTESGKQPFFFSRADGELTVFAGLWEYWEREGNGLYTCSIITTDASEDMEDVHNRMPVILEPDAWQEWLAPANEGESVSHLLAPAPGGTLAKHPVTKSVGSVRNDGPELVEQVAA